MKEGILLKRFGGFYYVKSGEETWACSLRGRFRKLKLDIFPGDRVLLSVLEENKGVIEEILPRKNRLIRPQAANVEQVLVTFAMAHPSPDLLLLDRILIMVQHQGLVPVIVFNKTDLVSPKEADHLAGIYRRAGYQVIKTSSNTGTGIDEVRSLLLDKISLFAGPSGVGKSSLANAIQPGLSLKTGEVSSKIGRGRHTTKHVELLEVEGGGLIADTPGFSLLDMPDIPREDLPQYFYEIQQEAGFCRFTSCLHQGEVDCAVKEAVDAGRIDPGRYERYLMFLNEIKEKKRRF